MNAGPTERQPGVSATDPSGHFIASTEPVYAMRPVQDRPPTSAGDLALAADLVDDVFAELAQQSRDDFEP